MKVASLRPGVSVLEKARTTLGSFLAARPGATSDPDDQEWFTDGLMEEATSDGEPLQGDHGKRGDSAGGLSTPSGGIIPPDPMGPVSGMLDNDGVPIQLDIAARRAMAETGTQRPGEITTEHLLVNLLELYPAMPLLRAGLTTDHIREVTDLPPKGVRLSSDLERLYSPGLESKPERTPPSEEKLLARASHELKVILQTINVNPEAELSPTQIRDGILAFASAFRDSDIGMIMQAAGQKALHAARLGAVQRFMRENPGQDPASAGLGVSRPGFGPGDLSGRPEDSEAVKEWRQLQSDIKPMKTINSMCEDLTLRAANGLAEEIVGRNEELDQIAIALQEMKKGGALVVGQPGIGKTALVEALANKIVQGEYAGLKGYRVVSLPIGNLVADTQLRGALEEKVKNIINEAKDQKVVLFMDEFHTIVGAGKAQGESSDIANLFKPAKGVKMIGCTTEKEYSEKFKADAAFARRFELVKLAEPNRDTTHYILETLVPKLEAHHNVTYTPDSVETAINLCDRFVPGHSPDKEITALDRTGARARHHGESVVDADMVTEGIEQSTGIPLKRIQQSHGLSPTDIKTSLSGHVIGQEDALDAVATAIFQARAGVNPNRPSVMVFSGPTGTGKTELAKAVARVDGRHMIRIDMETVKNLSTLKGAEPGFIGHERDGILTGPQALHPYSVVLFDEIEKAPDEVLKALLGLLDDGEMVNSRGERVPFNNAMIIFTTNFGADAAGSGTKRPFGFDLGDSITPPTTERDDKRTKTQNVKDRLAERLGPEYINRFRNFVLFNELTEDNTRDITRLLLSDIAEELGTSKNMSFDFDARLVFMIGKNGHDPKSGAREVRRICDNIVRSAVGRALLQWPELGNLDKKHHLDVAMTGPEMIEVTITTEGEEASRLLKLPVSRDLRYIDLA
jgi:ATP-dependent Clp protease ATP-binding subunit ClpC